MTLLPAGVSRTGPNMQKSQTFKIFSITEHVREKTKCLDIRYTKPSNKVVKFVAPWSGVQVLGRGQFGSIV